MNGSVKLGSAIAIFCMSPDVKGADAARDLDVVVDNAARVNNLVLIGDARAQLGATDDTGAATSFGGGILYRTTKTLTVVLLSTSPERAEVTSEAEAGAFILTPWASQVSADVELEYFPWAERLREDSWSFGFRGRFAIGGSEWISAKGTDAEESRNENVVAVDVGAGGRQVFVADANNYAEVFGFVGPHVRVLGGDGGNSFRRGLTGTGDSVFLGALLYGGLRLGRLEVGSQLSFTETPEGGRLQGLSNLQFLVGIELRDGPVIAGAYAEAN